MARPRKAMEAQYRVAPDGSAPQTWTARHYATLAVPAAGLAQGIASSYGYSAWWSIVIGGCAVAAHLTRHPLVIGSLRGWKMTITLVVASLTGGLVGAMVRTPVLGDNPATHLDTPAQQALSEADITRLLTIGVTNPEQQARMLEELADSTLQGLEQRMPKQVAAELKRREGKRSAIFLEQQSAMEIRNEPEIRKLLSAISDMAPNDTYGRQEAYSKLVALAPDNQTYAREHERLTSKIEAMDYAAEHPASNIQVIRQRWSVGGFGIAYILDITLKNTGDRAWADFAIVCRNQAVSGTEIAATTGMLLQRLKPGQSKRYRHVVLGRLPQQAARSRCEIVDARPA